MTKEFKDYRICKGHIPIDIGNNELVSVERNAPLKMYGLGFQAAKCIPEIPEWFINKYSRRGIDYKILDPFAGSGTTIIEALKNNNTVFWADNNPLSRLICRCKSVIIEPEVLSDQLDDMTPLFSIDSEVNVEIVFANRDLWFQKPVQEALTIIKSLIKEINNEDVQNAFLLAFSITVRKMSEMEDSMILAARRSNNREIIQYSRKDVYDNFVFNMNRVIEAYDEWKKIIKKPHSFDLETNDARVITKNNYFDAIVTSPPYINAMDYIWATKFELHWLDMVEDDKERLAISDKEIGTERIKAKEYKELAVSEDERLNRILSDIYFGKKYKATKGQNEMRSRVVYRYFNDMDTHFKSAYNALKTGGKYCFIIGDVSTICGVEIPVANMLRDIAEKNGFRESFRFNLLLKNRRLNIPRASFAGTIKHDTVIVLEKE